jgi:small conductance mechanosensitive channel
MFTLLAEGASAIGGLDLDKVILRVTGYVSEHGPDLAVNILAAIAIFVVGRWLANLATRLFATMLERAKLDETLAKFLARIAHTLMLLFVAMAALDRLGVNTTSFAAIVAAAGLAIGLALQGSLANFAAGVMIILFRPFKVGDFIEAGGVTGVVEEIHIFHTLMRTGDNVQLVVPNNSITAGNISNYSAKETRRIDLVVGCGYGDDLQAVKRFLGDLVDNHPRILPTPEPVVAVSELADNSVNFVVRPWVANADYWAVRWELTEAIKVGFDQHGFSIPFPQQDVHLHRVKLDAAQPESPPRNRQTPQVPAVGTSTANASTGLNQALGSGPPIDVFAQTEPKMNEIRPRRVG